MNRSILVAALTLLAALTTLSGCSQKATELVRDAGRTPPRLQPLCTRHTRMPPVSMAMKPMPRSR